MIQEFPQKHPYLVIALAIVVLIIVFGLMNGTKTAPSEQTEEEICEAAGGTWRQMPNACVDSCEAHRERLLCAQVLTYGCDCGEGMCWNGKTCEEI